MAFCPKCGASLESGTNFCAACGAGTVAAVTPVSTGISSNVAGLLCYIFGLITGVLFLILEPYKHDRFVRFHAFQSIFFNIASVVFWVAWNIVQGVLSVITHGTFAVIFIPLDLLIGLAFFACWLFLMFKAYNNQKYMLPVIGSLAEKQAESGI